MQVRVDTQHVSLPRRGAATLANRIARVFARAAAQVTRVHITLKDIRGGRNGRNKVCVLRADLADGGQVVVMDRSAKLRRALFRCLRRGRDLIRASTSDARLTDSSPSTSAASVSRDGQLTGTPPSEVRGRGA